MYNKQESVYYTQEKLMNIVIKFAIKFVIKLSHKNNI